MRKAVIFDMDGTLLDTLEDLYRSTNAVLARYGFPERTLEEVREFVGNAARNLMRQAIPQGEDNPHFEECIRAFQAYYGAHLNDHTEPYDGIPELLERLSGEGAPMAIVSNKPDFAVRELNERYFAGLIPVAIGESERVRRKPAPDTVEQAAERLVVRLRDCIYVGDSEVDLLTAKNCGIPCVSVTWGFRSRELLLSLGAEHLAKDTEELYRMLQEMD